MLLFIHSENCYYELTGANSAQCSGVTDTSRRSWNLAVLLAFLQQVVFGRDNLKVISEGVDIEKMACNLSLKFLKPYRINREQTSIQDIFPCLPFPSPPPLLSPPLVSSHSLLSSPLLFSSLLTFLYLLNKPMLDTRKAILDPQKKSFSAMTNLPKFHKGNI